MISVTVAWVLTCGISGILLWAGLEKLRSPRAFKKTLADLGLRTEFSRIVLVVIPLAELAAALGVVLAPGHLWPAVIVAALAAGFALAGLLGIRSGQRISCSCFGGPGGTVLGARQLYELPLWLAAVGALLVLSAEWRLPAGLLSLAGVVAVVAGVRASSLVTTRRAAAADRRACDEALRPRHNPMFVTGKETS